MKKILELIKKHLLCSYVILNVLFILVTSFLYSYGVSSYHLNSILYIPFLALNIIVIISYIVFKKKNKEKTGFKIFDIYLLIFFVFTLISAIFSINTSSAFMGHPGRYEGFFQISYYFTVFFLASFLNKDEKKTVLLTVLALGFIETLYAHFQKFKLFNVPISYENKKPLVLGLVSNSNFLGTLTLLSLSISIGFLFDFKTNKEKVIYLLLSIFFMSGLLISDTLSAVVGLFIVLIYVFIYALINKQKLLFIITFILISLITLIESSTGNTSLVKDLIKTKDQSIEIAKGNIQDNFGTNRMFIWRNTIKIVPDNLIYGVGVDNFYYAFGDRPLVRKHRYFDKAHNEYLQILVCEGIFALISYLLFISDIVIKGIKYCFKNKILYLIIPIIGYLVQAFFNISVIEVAPLFYICLGLCSNREKNI